MTAPARLVREGFPLLIPTPRAPGRHLSDVTRSLCAGLGDFDPDSDPPRQLMGLGLTFEWGLTNALMQHCPNCYLKRWDAQWGVWRTGMEITLDGIFGNVDMICTCDGSGCEIHPPSTPGVWAVEDAKFTRKSRNKPHDVEQLGTGTVQWAPPWREAWMRVAGYCWMTGCRVGRLWVSHVFDYSERFGGDAYNPVWERRWDTQEGERELETNWAVIVRHERGMPPVEE